MANVSSGDISGAGTGADAVLIAPGAGVLNNVFMQVGATDNTTMRVWDGDPTGDPKILWQMRLIGSEQRCGNARSINVKFSNGCYVELAGDTPQRAGVHIK